MGGAHVGDTIYNGSQLVVPFSITGKKWAIYITPDSKISISSGQSILLTAFGDGSDANCVYGSLDYDDNESLLFGSLDSVLAVMVVGDETYFAPKTPMNFTYSYRFVYTEL